jgi:hypothetical protein
MSFSNPPLKFIFSSLASLFVLTGLSSAQITTIQYSSASFNPATTTASAPGNSVAPYVATVTIPAFQESIGMLQGIELSLTLNGTESVDVINIANTTEAFNNASATIPITVTGPGGLTATIDPTSGPVSGNASFGQNVQTAGAQFSQPDGVLLAANSSYESNTPGAVVSIPLTFTVGTGTYTGSGSPDLFFGGQPDAYAIVSVQYIYCLCPEPSTSSMLGLALGACCVGGFFFRKRLLAA